MFRKFATMLIFLIIFLSSTTFSSKAIKIKFMKKTVKIKCMKKINSTRNKLQYLDIDNFETVLKFLNFDDLSHFLHACEKSKSNYLRETILSLCQKFHKKQSQESIEYLSFSKAKPPPQNNSTIFFQSIPYINYVKTILLPKFVKHVIQTPKYRIVSHIDGFFSIEQKLQNQKQYLIVSTTNLIFQFCGDLNLIDINFIKLLNFRFSSKHFMTSILNHKHYIFMIFQGGQIFLCGKTGKAHICVFKAKSCTPAISHFISREKTYFMSYFEKKNNFVVYHISSGEIFCFENSKLKSILLNPNSKLDYNFLKNNGKSSRFLNSEDNLSSNICIIDIDEMSKPIYSPRSELFYMIENL